MATHNFSKQALISFCLFLFCAISFAQYTTTGNTAGWQGHQQQGECNLHNLNPLEPNRRIEHEGGVTEFWDENNEQLRCAGVSATRHILQPRSLLLPSFNNAPMLVLVVQGRGILQTMIPGCPETYHSFQQPQGERGSGQRQIPRDSHQKLHNLQRGDAVALPEGVAHWVYNEGNEELVLVVIHHTSNQNNQLDPNLRRFFLAGNPQQQQQRWQQGQGSQQEQQRQEGNNVFQALDTEILAEAFGVNQETARKLQNQDDWRGNIVKVQEGFQMLRPRSSSEQQEEEREYQATNGIEETICTLRIRENLVNPERADIYTAHGGSISTLNSLNLPILKYIRLSAGRGNLQPNAMVTPHWNLNAHSISYIARGNARVQIVGTSKRAAFDGEVRQGHLLIIPQNFVHVKQAGNEGMEWFTVKTNDQAKSSPLAGKTSVIRAMPVDVLVNAYQVSREEARRLKYNREEVTILSPRQSGRHGSSPSSLFENVL